MLQNLSLIQFKCFQRAVVNFRRLTALAGSNSVGKSSVIQSILLCKSAADKIQSQQLGTGGNAKSISIALSGPYELQLGNSKEVLTRDVDENIIEFKFIEDDQSTLKFRAEDVKPNVFHLDLTDWNIHPSSILLNKSFQYLNAERIGPRARHEMDDLDEENVGCRGEFAVQLLHEKREKEIEAKKNLDKSNESKSKLLPLTREWMNFIIPGFYLDEITAFDSIKAASIVINKSTPPNVGFGISYVLPIVVAGLLSKANGILIVENPEAHLHPSGQSKIGRFLARIASTGTQVIIETHSEHVINGMRLEVVTNPNEGSETLIDFFDISIKGTETPAREIEIANSGDFSQFPLDFFDQAQQDLAAIFEATTMTVKNG